MEANREEAVRAKEIAEQKFSAKDVAGAKKFALKAQNLFPALEGINQMIATLDVFLSAEVKISGESDWYSILCSDAFADDETVKKQYRKLALQLHPDKNKSIGAEAAFKLISEAWSVLSDKSRKMMYDQKRNTKVLQQKVSQSKRKSSVPTNGFYNFANNGSSNVKKRQKTTAMSSTFWTSCNQCRMQYEYLRVYLNHNLLCPNCHEAFLAIETGFPANGSNSSASLSAAQQRRQNSNHTSKMNSVHGHKKDHCSAQGSGNIKFQNGANADSFSNTTFQWGAFSRTTGAASAAASSSAAVQAASMVQQTYEKVRKEREEAQTTVKMEEALQKKNRVSKRNFSASGNINAGLNGDLQEQYTKVDRPPKRAKNIGGGIGSYFGKKDTEASSYKVLPSGDQCFNSYVGSESGRINGGSVHAGKARVGVTQNNVRRELAQTDFRNMLIQKAKSAIDKKLEEWNSAAAEKLAEKEKAKKIQKHRDSDNGMVSAAVDVKANNQNKRDDFRNSNKQIPLKKDIFIDSASDKEVIQPLSIDVPDPDFHDFDKDRSEGYFAGEQVWATYDNEDGMPRFYALVQKVISLKPFKIRMSFLNSKSNSELGPLNWVGSGFAKTCGDFRIGKYQITDTVNIFSHRVNWEKGTRGIVRIIPRKGDTWALYRNWSPDWNVLTPDDMIYKYDMVEVLDDYNNEQGVSVTPLVKVAGFKTVFHRHLDPKEVKRIPREEMFRFSHQVPSYLLTGEEAHDAPKGCRELDPAATPLELLQVLTEVKEVEVMETAEQQQVN